MIGIEIEENDNIFDAFYFTDKEPNTWRRCLVGASLTSLDSIIIEFDTFDITITKKEKK